MPSEFPAAFKECLMSTEQPSNNMSTEVDGESDPTLHELLAQGVEHVKTLDAMIHRDFSHKPEFVAEWDAIMREYADVFAKHEKEAEEKRLSEEIDKRIQQINADLDRFTDREGPDLEVDEALARNFASIHDIDGHLSQKSLPQNFYIWPAT